MAVASDAGPVVVEDAFVRYELARGWTATGEGGEYWLEGEHDVASLLLMPPDPDMSLEMRLAEIEEQFLSTGVISRETSETREMEDDVVHVRHYRLESGGSSEPGAVLLHQYSFVRSSVRVLLQVETSSGGGGEEDLFRVIYETLEILQAPEPFDVDAPPLEVDGPGAAPEREAGFEAPVDSSGATVYEPGEPEPGK